MRREPVRSVPRVHLRPSVQNGPMMPMKSSPVAAVSMKYTGRKAYT